MHTLFVITTADREDPDSMPHNLHCLLSQKLSSEKKTAILFRIKTCDPLNATKDRLKFID